jgi:Putative transmembrane protein (Alph_Pro_TM)
LIRNGKVVAADDSVIVNVSKTGFERLITILAEDYALFYGAMAVLISLLLGWLAGIAFRKL